MSLVSEFDQITRERRAHDLMGLLWTGFQAFEMADPRVIELARADLLDLKERIDRLVGGRPEYCIHGYAFDACECGKAA